MLSKKSLHPKDDKLYLKIKKEMFEKYPHPSAYRSGLLVKEYKKQYSLKEEKKAISENYFDETLHSIKQTFQNPDSVKAFWQDINYQRYAIFQIKVDKDWINLCFSKVIVDDFFFNDSSKHEIKALSKVQKIVTSDPIFREILLNALANETTQKSFKKRETTTYYVQPEDFLDKDYRDPSNGYR